MNRLESGARAETDELSCRESIRDIPMARLARAEVIDPGQVSVVHVFNRTVRRCFLLGDDPISGKNFDYRKHWIEQTLEHFSSQFGIDLLGFAILSNHFHLLVRTRPDIVATWDDTEVARRWLMVCPHRRLPDGSPAVPTEAELNTIRNCSEKVDKIRERLANISWWMRLLCQRVASRANREDGESGRFWQDRFRAVRLLDEASLLACSVYIDLNPIRAAIAENILESDHTSIQRRVQAAHQNQTDSFGNVRQREDSRSPTPDRTAATPISSIRSDAFLSPLTIDENSDQSGPYASESPYRCSDKGFLPISLNDYLQLLDWTARQWSSGRRRRIPDHVRPIVSRLGVAPTAWSEIAMNFGKLFTLVAGHPGCVDQQRSNRTQRRFHLRRRVRELMPVAS